MKANFEFERETKNTYRFTETSNEPIIGKLYISKEAFKEANLDLDENIIVTIEQ